MNIGFCYDLLDDNILNSDDPKDKYYEWDEPKLIAYISSAIIKNGYELTDIGNFDNLFKNVDNFKQNIDIVFNLCEGLEGRNRESEVPLLLEKTKIPYIGSDALSMGLTLDKVLSKKIFYSENILTPKYFWVTEQLEFIGDTNLKYPLFVKLRWEGSSKGIDEGSVIKSKNELKERIDILINKYQEPVIVEEFISGREFTVPVIGNGNDAEACSVNEIIYNNSEDKLKDYFSSRQVFDFQNVKYTAQPDLSEILINEIREIALTVHRSMEIKDFSRIDMRMDSKEKIFVLEINPLPSLSDEDHFGVMRKFKGWSYEQMIGNIINAGRKRYGI